MVADLFALTEAFAPEADSVAAKSRDLTLMLLRLTLQPLSRDQFTPGHVTATAVVWSPAGDEVLLVWHKRLQRWLLPGGHVEADDTSIFDTARREAIEETGVLLDDAVPPRVVSIDVHGIPPKGREPYHLHHDFLVRFVARDKAVRTCEENEDVRWWRVGNLTEAGLDVGALRALRD